MTDPADKPTFELEHEPEPPRLPGGVIYRKDAYDLYAALAAEFMMHAFNCVRAFGDFHVAFSGGSTPLPFYRRLMSDPVYRDIPWNRCHLWLVDERRVPFDDERCNWTQIAGYLLDHSDIPKTQVHPMHAMREDAAEAYEAELRESLGWRERGHDRLDFVLLGVGADGHTASLFPHSPALDERTRLVAINAGPTVTPPDRVTMTYPILNSARFLAVLVTGTSKKPIIARLAAPAPKDDERALPILGVKPLGDAVRRWYLDAEACPD